MKEDGNNKKKLFSSFFGTCFGGKSQVVLEKPEESNKAKNDEDNKGPVEDKLAEEESAGDENPTDTEAEKSE